MSNHERFLAAQRVGYQRFGGGFSSADARRIARETVETMRESK